MDERTYDGRNGNSYFWDRCVLAAPGHPDQDEARQRLQRHGEEVDRAAAGSSENRALRDANRHAESRAMDTTGSSGGSLVTPEYLIEKWAPFKAPYRAFADQCELLPLGDSGMIVDVPSFTSAPTVAQQTENTGVSHTDPSGGYITGGTNVVTQAGEIVASQQVFDRTGPTINFDEVAVKQLLEQLNAAIDLYVINLVIANAAAPISDPTFSIASFYGDVAKGREGLTDTAGTRVQATHVFTTNDLFSFVTRQVDATTNRPVVTPDSAALVASAPMGDPERRAWTGIHLPGALCWYTDDNIPASGSNTRIIVSRPSLVSLHEGRPLTFAYPQTLGGQLSVVISLRKYVAAVTRYPNAHSIITGAAYPTTAV
jgi:hypothetical protein